MQIYQNISLADRNTLRLAASAAWFCEVSTLEELKEAVAFAASRQLPVIPLGEGSNIVLAGDLDALVIRNQMLGVTTDKERVTAGGGENWHDLVVSTVKSGLYGLENLALIPGTAGAAPVQNIGAYGVELADRLVSLRALHLPTLETRVFNREDCKFAYRESLFKKEDIWFITEITLQLSATSECLVNYPGIASYLEARSLAVSGASILEAVSQIRREKLPDPAISPNAGSFFKNPVVPIEIADSIRQAYPDAPQFEVSGGRKLSAAWLIDSLDLKGSQAGDMAVSDKHALVLVNRGQGRQSELFELVDGIRRKVWKTYGIALEIEPRVYPAGDFFKPVY